MLTVDANVWVAAFDPHDAFHRTSVAFLQAALDAGEEFLGPAFLAVEAGCAIARRADDAALGVRACEELLANPVLGLEPMTPDFLETAARIGAHARLRAADALYAAVAERSATRLVTWDQELIRRIHAVSPEDWLAER